MARPPFPARDRAGFTESGTCGRRAMGPRKHQACDALLLPAELILRCRVRGCGRIRCSN